MKNNKGFIAISLMYSFFLVFLITLLAVATNYAKNRILLNDVKKETQNYLNEQIGFNPINLDKVDTTVGNEVRFGEDTWIVLENKERNSVTHEYKVKLLLKRALTTEEMSAALGTIVLGDVQKNLSFTEDDILDRTNNKIKMCYYNLYSPNICSYLNSQWVHKYAWSQSIVKHVVKYWYDNNAVLKKAESFGKLAYVTEDVEDEIEKAKIGETEYIRIPIYQESGINNAPFLDNMWFLTSYDDTDRNMNIKDKNGNATSTYNNKKEIHPIIIVNKTDKNQT